MTWHVVVSGAPRTKKTSNQAAIMKAGPRKDTGKVHGQPCPKCGTPLRALVFPSANWKKWVREAVITINGDRLVKVPGDVLVTVPRDGSPARTWTPIAVDLNCAALFYREKHIGDRMGFEQGLSDLLQERGVIVNDRQLVTGDGTRLLKDATNPRVELTLTVVVADQQLAMHVTA